MDFNLSEEQTSVRDLAAQIFEGSSPTERVKAVEAADGFDAELWQALADSDLLGICLPDDVGGSGYGMIEAALVLEQQGRFVAPVPLLGTYAAAMTIAEFGTSAQRQLLASVITGSTIIASALAERGANDPLAPTVVATPTDGGYRLVGAKPSVPFARQSSVLLVSARVADSVGVFVVDTSHVTLYDEVTSSHQPQCSIDLDVVVAADALLGGSDADGRDVLRHLLYRTLAGMAAVQLGVAEEAVKQTAAFVSARQQFGKPLSTFQAVGQRAADAYVDVESMRVTMFQAVWSLAEGFEADSEVLVASWWAKEGGFRVVRACQHLHGGMGADIDYPIHRHFLWGIQNELLFGGASAQLARLGTLIAKVGG
jgi:3-oxocholest-4-en-26-oyl-CoA dehydrogenase beta subunit